MKRRLYLVEISAVRSLCKIHRQTDWLSASDPLLGLALDYSSIRCQGISKTARAEQGFVSWSKGKDSTS